MSNLYFIKFGDLEMGGAIYSLVCAETKEKAQLLVSGLDKDIVSRAYYRGAGKFLYLIDGVIEVGEMNSGDIKFVVYFT